MFRQLLFILLASISSIATADVSPKAEMLLGFEPTKTGILFQVTSGGCTHKEDFLVEVKRNEVTKVSNVTLFRVRPDLCHPFMPMGERFHFSFDELGLTPGDRFTVKNQNGIIEGWIW